LRKMAEAKDSEAGQEPTPPAYTGSFQNEPANGKSSRQSKVLFGYSVAVTTALIVVLIMGGVYYYRSLDVIEESIKKFGVGVDSAEAPLSQDLEVDAVNQYVVFRLNGIDLEPGTFAVLDYTKSMTGIYDPKGHQCFLIAGISTNIADLQTLSTVYEKNNSTDFNVTSVDNLYYTLADNYPVSDKNILPAPLKNACTSIPVYWLEPVPADKTHNIQKRVSLDLESVFIKPPIIILPPRIYWCGLLWRPPRCCCSYCVY